MTAQEWDDCCAEVNSRMQGYVANFVTPLSVSEEFGSGEAWGSATYIKGSDGYVYIMTAGHNITGLPAYSRMAHLPVSGGEYVAADNMAILSPQEIDAAGVAIPPIPPLQPPPGRIVPTASIGNKYCAVKDELLFWMGFPGYKLDRDDPIFPDARKRSLFEHLELPMKPMLSQEVQAPFTHSRFDPNLHLAVHYPKEGKSAVDNSRVLLPTPKGMSGSAIWDTKFIATVTAGGQWKPEQAEICGIVWFFIGSPGPEVLLATKIEHIRRYIPEMF